MQIVNFLGVIFWSFGIFSMGAYIPSPQVPIFAYIQHKPIVFDSPVATKPIEFRTDNDIVPDESGFIGVFFTTRYYTPIPGQKKYFPGSYEADQTMNCGKGGDCFTTSSGHKVVAGEEYRIFACPSALEKGTKLRIEGVGEGTCEDRGGAIKRRKLDIWVGIGDTGIENLASDRASDTLRRVYIIK